MFLKFFWQFETFTFGQVFPATRKKRLESLGEWLPRRYSARHHAHGLSQLQLEGIALPPDDHAGWLLIGSIGAEHPLRFHPVPGVLFQQRSALRAERGVDHAGKGVAGRRGELRI